MLTTCGALIMTGYGLEGSPKVKLVGLQQMTAH